MARNGLYSDGSVYCVENGAQVVLLPRQDTAAMRADFTYVYFGNSTDEAQEVVPCGGLNRMPEAFWRGLPGNPMRARELALQARANAQHRQGGEA